MNTKLTDKITKAAKEFTKDYFKFPSRADYVMIENAMLAGAKITLNDINEELDSEKENRGGMQELGNWPVC